MAVEKRSRKRADGSVYVTWRARLALPDGAERCRVFGKKGDADRWWREQRTDLARGEWLDPRDARATVAEVADLWLSARAALKASTRENYRELLAARVLPKWGAVRLRAVGHGDIAAWVAALTAEGVGASRVRQAVSVLASVLDLAVRDGRLARNPARGVPLPHQERPTDRPYLSNAQLDALAAACGDSRLLVLVLGTVGVRFGEAAALRVRDVDLLRRRLHVCRSAGEVAGRLVIDLPKTGRIRQVPCMPSSSRTWSGR